MKVPTQKLIIRADNIYNYYAKHGNLTLYVDPLFKPGQRKIITGDVAFVCENMRDGCRIVNEVKAGDKVYFHYNSLSEDNMVPGHPGLWVVEYDSVFCSVRNGDIIMIGSRVLAEPVYDDDIIEIEVDGFKHKAKITPSGLVKQLDPGYNLNKARMSHIGSPLIGDPEVPVKPGDIFYYIKNADFKNNIEGKEYFVMMQDEILAVELTNK